MTTHQSTPAEYPAAAIVAETITELPVPQPGARPRCLWGDPVACQDDNDLRAATAAATLRAYAELTGSLEEPPRSVIEDLLNDLRHLCDGLDIDHDYLFARSLHYDHELRGTF